MRVAALYDIHGNLPALEAVLEEVDRLAVDIVLVGGDIVPGPMPAEAIELLLDLGGRARFVRGNADRHIVESFESRPDDWTVQQISPSQRAFLANLPEAQVIEVDELGVVRFVHASPRNDEEILTIASPQERLFAALRGVREPVVVCGHTHMQFDRIVDGIRLVNAGSVGMPYGEPGAYWALLGPGAELRRTDYDRRRAAARIRASTWPQAEDFANENVLSAPSAAEAVSYFEAQAEGTP